MHFRKNSCESNWSVQRIEDDKMFQLFLLFKVVLYIWALILLLLQQQSYSETSYYLKLSVALVYWYEINQGFIWCTDFHNGQISVTHLVNYPWLTREDDKLCPWIWFRGAKRSVIIHLSSYVYGHIAIILCKILNWDIAPRFLKLSELPYMCDTFTKRRNPSQNELRFVPCLPNPVVNCETNFI